MTAQFHRVYGDNMTESKRTAFVRRTLFTLALLGIASAAGGLLGAASAQGPSDPVEDCPTCPVPIKFRCSYDQMSCKFDENGKSNCTVVCDQTCKCTTS